MKEFTISGKFHFDNKIVIDAANEKDALKQAQQLLVRMCKDMLSDKENVLLAIESQRTLSQEEVMQDLQDGVLEEKDIKKKDLKTPRVKKEKSAKKEEPIKKEKSTKKEKVNNQKKTPKI